MLVLKRGVAVRGALAMLAAVLFACHGGGGAPHAVGSSSFDSPPPGAPRGGGAEAVGGVAMVPAAASPDTSAGAPRAVEEPDLYQRSGTTLLVLNAFRGLQLIDLSDVAAPRLLARVPVVGAPVDLYLRGSTALVAVSDYLGCSVAAGELGAERGSRVFAIDVADPAHPAVTAELPVDGEVLQTRLVGDVLYVVSRQSRWYASPGMPGATAAAGSGATATAAFAVAPGWETVTVASFEVRDPAHPVQAAELQLPADGWDVHAHVTAERVTLSFSGWSPGLDSGPTTRFRVIDISAPSGALAPGAELSCAGAVRDRWAMDFDPATGLFRAVVSTGWSGGAALQIWRSPTPDAAAPLSRLALDVAETLTAARFDGDRVYAVTARQLDPLWAIDASDPENPVVAGALHMPGQLDFIEPRGTRLLALGHTNEAGQPFQLAVSLLDVTALASPRLVARAAFGASYGWVAAAPDDLRKAFIVLDPPPGGAGLVLVPVQGWDAATWRYQGGTQLLEWTPDALALRGFLAHPGAVKRSFALDASAAHLAAFSDAALQTVDASDRSAPRELARLDLARPVTALVLVGGHAVELAGDWFRGDVELAVTPALDPETPQPLARVHVGAPQARLYRDGDVVWVLAADWTSGNGWIEGHDFSDPAHPRVRGRIELSSADGGAGSEGPVPTGARPWYGLPDAVLVGHALVVHRSGWPCPEVCANAPGARGELRVFDLSDPDQPRLASAVDLGQGWSWGLRAIDRFVWVSEFDWDGSSERGRYYVDRVDLADPAQPGVLPRVNVPGIFFAASPDGQRIFTLESWWTDPSTPVTWAHALALVGSTARLEGSVALRGDAWQAEAEGGVAWVPTVTWTADAGPRARLYTLDLASMTIASEQAVRGSGAWLRRVADGKLLLQASWGAAGVLVYDLADPLHPAFERLFRTDGYSYDVVVGGGYAYLPSGPYGVPMLKLAP